MDLYLEVTLVERKNTLILLKALGFLFSSRPSSDL